MRIKKIALIITAVCMSVSCAGCWDAMDINEKSLITLVVTDRREDEFVLYFEVPNFDVGQNKSSGTGGGTEQFTIATGAGKTYAEARRNLNAKMDKPIFLGSVQALVITKELAEHGIEEYMFRMQNALDYRKTLYIAISEDKPEYILSRKPESNISIGKSIDQTINSLENDGKVVVYTISDILEFLYADYSFVLINMAIQEDRLAYNGYSIIQKGKYRGFVPLEDSKGIDWLAGDNINQLYVVPVDEYTVTVEVISTKKEITPVYSDGTITFNINFGFSAEIEYTEKNIIIDERVARQIKDSLQFQLVDDIASAISQSKSYCCDYLGFKELFRISYPDIVGRLDWETEYVNAEFNIYAQTELRAGNMVNYEAQGTPVPQEG